MGDLLSLAGVKLCRTIVLLCSFVWMASGRCRALQEQAQKQPKVKVHEASVVQNDLQHETGGAILFKACRRRTTQQQERLVMGSSMTCGSGAGKHYMCMASELRGGWCG
jgi:hypothetical protein